jgi:UDP-xylose/UDP-N-acetylglucosamine transporter B4
MISSKQITHDHQNKSVEEDDRSAWEMITFATGIFMLTFALFMSARMGIYQEVIYAKYGKHAKEALYYSHCLPLAGFLLLYNGIL